MTRRKVFASFFATGAIAPVVAQEPTSVIGLPLYGGWQALPTGHMFGSHGAIVEITPSGKRLLHIAVHGGSNGYVTHVHPSVSVTQARVGTLVAGPDVIPVVVAPGGAVILQRQPSHGSWLVGTVEV